MAITAGMSKCVGAAACVRGVVMKELVLGRHQFVHTSACTNFYSEYSSSSPSSSAQCEIEMCGVAIWQRDFIA